MTAIPAKSAFTGSSVTEGDFKTAFETMIDYLTGMLGSSGTQAAALQSLGALGGAVSTIATAYTVVAADRGKVISCSGTWTLSLTSAATLGAGFVVAAVNTGSGVITIDPADTETVNGNATWTLNAGDSVALVSNGVNWLAFAGYTALQKQSGMQVFTSSGTFTVPAGVTRVKATVVGGGSAGVNGGISGSGGGVAIKNIIGLTPGSMISVTVGGAGISSGASGGSSSFGGYCTANGGTYSGGGSASGGDLNFSGGGGGAYNSTYMAVGGGGGAGGHNGNSGTGNADTAFYGTGAAGLLGGSGANGGSSGGATGFGNGGSCTYFPFNATAGSPGVVIVEW